MCCRGTHPSRLFLTASEQVHPGEWFGVGVGGGFLSTPCSPLWGWILFLLSLDFCLFLSQKHSSSARLGPQVQTELQAASQCVHFHLAPAGASHSPSVCENWLFLLSSSWM